MQPEIEVIPWHAREAEAATNAGRGRKDSPLQRLEGTQFWEIWSLSLQNVSECISIALSHWLRDDLFMQPQETNTVPQQ